MTGTWGARLLAVACLLVLALGLVSAGPQLHRIHRWSVAGATTDAEILSSRVLGPRVQHGAREYQVRYVVDGREITAEVTRTGDQEPPGFGTARGLLRVEYDRDRPERVRVDSRVGQWTPVVTGAVGVVAGAGGLLALRLLRPGRAAGRPGRPRRPPRRTSSGRPRGPRARR